jgi:hypothetical protein
MTIAFTKNTPDDRIPEILRKWQIGQHIAMTVQGPWKIWTRLVKGRPDRTSRTRSAWTSARVRVRATAPSTSPATKRRPRSRHSPTPTPPLTHSPASRSLRACGAAVVVNAATDLGKQRRPRLRLRQPDHAGVPVPESLLRQAGGHDGEKVGKRWGWRSSPEKKAVALGELRRAYAHGGFVNPDEKALDEALTYISYEGGGIGPASLVEESESNRKSHGDRVIADMLCVWGMRGKHKNKRREGPPPKGTIAQRFAEFKRARREAEQKNTFDFSGAR